jgi:rod shape determining protein RodA
MKEIISAGWTLIAPVVIVLLSLFTLYTTSPDNTVNQLSVENVVLRQFIFFLVALVLMIIIWRINLVYTQNVTFQSALLVASAILLLGLFILGGLVNATRRWYVFGPFLLQPSEFIKYTIILWSAFFLTFEKIELVKRLAITCAGVFFLLLLIFFQPDAGTTIMTLFIFGVVLSVYMFKYNLGRKIIGFLFSIAITGALAYVTGIWILLGISIVVLILLSWNDITFFKISVSLVIIGVLSVGGIWTMWQTGIIRDYQKERILSFIGTTEESHQISQSKIAIGSGGWFGKGPGQGTQSRLRYLPEYRTDFIFAAFVEERGFVGAAILIILYMIIILRILFIALRTEDEYLKLIAVGLAVKIWIEAFVNIGMNLGLLPTKGVALPFLSYGGSSMLSNFILLGIVQSIYYSNFHRSDTIKRLSTDFGELSL